jgi:hypothetical protein
VPNLPVKTIKYGWKVPLLELGSKVHGSEGWIGGGLYSYTSVFPPFLPLMPFTEIGEMDLERGGQFCVVRVYFQTFSNRWKFEYQQWIVDVQPDCMTGLKLWFGMLYVSAFHSYIFLSPSGILNFSYWDCCPTCARRHEVKLLLLQTWGFFIHRSPSKFLALKSSHQRVFEEGT